MNKLEFWLKEIEKYEKLTLEEVKKLYIELVNLDDDIRKNTLRNQIINSTLYVPLNYLKKSKLEILENGFYDMDDIISTTIEYFIKCLDEGRLLDIKVFSNLFDSNYYTFLNNIFVPQKENMLESQEIGLNVFGDFFEIYLNLKSNYSDVSREMFINDISNKIYRYRNYLNSWHRDYRYLCGCFDRFEKIYSRIPFDDNNLPSKTKLLGIRQLLMDLSLWETIDENIKEEKYFEDELIDSKIKNDFISNIFNNDYLSETEKQVLKIRFGLDDGVSKTLEETIKYTKYKTRERVRQIEARALRKIRRRNIYLKFRGN